MSWWRLWRDRFKFVREAKGFVQVLHWSHGELEPGWPESHRTFLCDCDRKEDHHLNIELRRIGWDE